MSIFSTDMESVRVRARGTVLRRMASWTLNQIATFLARSRQARQRHRALRQLEAMEDWQLRDIGLDRRAIEAELVKRGMRLSRTVIDYRGGF